MANMKIKIPSYEAKFEEKNESDNNAEGQKLKTSEKVHWDQ